jgi:ABC-type multidrug transport system fused ATPase/permease subunit
VRAYGAAPAAAAKAAALLDANWRAYCSTVAANRWLAVRVESLSAGLTAGAALVAVLMAPGGGPTFASSAGLAVSTIMGISQYLNWMVRMLSEVETALVAVERVAEYAELPGEGDGEGEAGSSASAPPPPPASWPSAGAINITNLRLRYRVDTRGAAGAHSHHPSRRAGGHCEPHWRWQVQPHCSPAAHS